MTLRWKFTLARNKLTLRKDLYDYRDILGENGGLSNLTTFQGCRRKLHYFFWWAYLSDDLSRNRGWYLNYQIWHLYHPVQKVEEQLNPPIKFDKSGNITFVLELLPPWVENVTCQIRWRLAKASEGWRRLEKAGEGWCVLVFYKCQECVRAL